MTNVRSSLWVLCLVVLAGTAVACKRETPPVNVILVSIDTLRADRLNAYGYAARQLTPNLDAFARDGVLFERHVASSPWTTPSHLSILTGLNPSRHGVTTSFGQLMKHLQHQGRRRLDSLPSARLTLAEALTARGYRTAAFAGAPTLAPQIGFSQGFEEYEMSQQKLNARTFRRVQAWLEAADRTRPFFLFWHTFEVHAPYLRTTFLREILPPAEAGRLEEAMAAYAAAPGRRRTRRLEEILEAHGAYTREVCDALYDGGVAWMDAYMGQLFASLKRQGLYDRTLIVLTSDHGEELGDRGVVMGKRGRGIYNSHGHTMYEELVHVPLIVKLLGQAQAGRRVREVTRAIDVMPTVLDLLGATTATHEMQGVSLRPTLDGTAPRHDLISLSEALAGNEEKKALRTARFKYIVSVAEADVERLGRDHLPEHPAAIELYDLSQDPRELNNLLLPRPGARPPDTLVAQLDRALRSTIGGPAAPRETAPVDQETLEGLKALGYIE